MNPILLRVFHQFIRRFAYPITRCAFIFFILFLLVNNVQAQQLNNTKDDIDIDTTNKTDLIDIAKTILHYKPEKKQKREKRKVYFSLLPTTSGVPGGSKALITSTKAGFYLGSRRSTSLSSVSFSPYLNFKGRYSIAFKSDIYTNKNRFNIQGDTRFSLYPEYVYGNSANGMDGQKLLISYKYIRFYQTVLKRLKPYFLAGIGYNLDYHIGVQTIGGDTLGLGKFTDYSHGTGQNTNTVSSGVTFNVLYDLRNNSINPLPGAYVNFIYRVNPFFLGNGDNSWKSIYLDTRKYIALAGRKRHVLALWNYIWTALDNDVPFLDLPGIGYEPSQRSGRGFEQNRYRGKTLVYLESEYRSDLTENGLFGFVVFANVNTVNLPGPGSFTAPHPAAGAGLRIKFNKRSNTNIALDFGISKGHTGYSLNLGEAF